MIDWLKKKAKTILISLGILGVASAAFILQPDIELGADPSLTREIQKYEVYLEDGVSKVKYSYKANEISGKNIVNENSERISDNVLRFYSGNQFLKVGNSWHQLEFATTTADKFRFPVGFKFIKNALADTFAPSRDGRLVDNTPTNQTWAGITGSVGDAEQMDEANEQMVQVAGDQTDRWNALVRSEFDFDTSSIPDTDTVSACSLNVWGTNKSDISGNAPITGAYNNTDGTYAGAGTTEETSTITFANWSNTGYNVFTCNATGQSYISKTGTTRLVLRFDDDVNGTAPIWGNGVSTFIQMNYVEAGGTANDPYLDVTFAPAGGAVEGVNSVMIISD